MSSKLKQPRRKSQANPAQNNDADLPPVSIEDISSAPPGSNDTGSDASTIRLSRDVDDDEDSLLDLIDIAKPSKAQKKRRKEKERKQRKKARGAKAQGQSNTPSSLTSTKPGSESSAPAPGPEADVHETTETPRQPSSSKQEAQGQALHIPAEALQPAVTFPTPSNISSPKYKYWNEVAKTQPEAQLLARRLGMRFPDPPYEDYSSRIQYLLYRFIAVAEDTPDNISMSLRPDWAQEDYTSVRLGVLEDNQPIDGPCDEDLAKWCPRSATVEEQRMMVEGN
ncbi:hypothetical protein BDV96DRAFT_652055 [Lophiotrema nucula]|uniref:Uncharacterized protein n=1 Tax=Lophiotrema nucula TaxID=690887 RepID=A0A6A5YSZ4_9PLEO|nr:hypothetical protein BDV96DRAFT_652055 [Lophiotrema nucula]